MDMEEVEKWKNWSEPTFENGKERDMNQTLKEIDFHSWFSFLVFTLNSIIYFSAQHASNIWPSSSAAFSKSYFVFFCLNGFYLRVEGFCFLFG